MAVERRAARRCLSRLAGGACARSARRLAPPSLLWHRCLLGTAACLATSAYPPLTRSRTLGRVRMLGHTRVRALDAHRKHTASSSSSLTSIGARHPITTRGSLRVAAASTVVVMANGAVAESSRPRWHAFTARGKASRSHKRSMRPPATRRYTSRVARIASSRVSLSRL